MPSVTKFNLDMYYVMTNTYTRFKSMYQKTADQDQDQDNLFP